VTWEGGEGGGWNKTCLLPAEVNRPFICLSTAALRISLAKHTWEGVLFPPISLFIFSPSLFFVTRLHWTWPCFTACPVSALQLSAAIGARDGSAFNMGDYWQLITPGTHKVLQAAEFEEACSLRVAVLIKKRIVCLSHGFHRTANTQSEGIKHMTMSWGLYWKQLGAGERRDECFDRVALDYPPTKHNI
jgi:hypothetical protein